MSGYGYWGRDKARDGDFYERAYRRKGLAEWDAKWHGLSPEARAAFVETMKGPARNQADHAPSYLVSQAKFPADALEELVAAGFAGVVPSRTKASAGRVFAPGALYDFAARVRMINRHHLLRGDRPAELARYTEQAFYTWDLLDVLRSVIRKAGMEAYVDMDVAIRRYVMNRRWPGWVGQALKDPVADRIVKALLEAGGPVPIAELPGQVSGDGPEKVRAAADRLIARLVLFEDLDPQTSDIVVDFLPGVREGLGQAARPRVRPPLVACERPKEVGPDDSPIVGDLRAFLLEVAAEPPLLRKDLGLFQKEHERFRSGLEPLPSWLSGMFKWSDDSRLGQALAWARALKLVEDFAEGAQLRLRLTSRGRKWLSSGLDAQYAEVYALVNPVPTRSRDYTIHAGLFPGGPYPYYYLDDSSFLGEHIMVLRGAGMRKYIPDYWESKPEDIRALREALDRSTAGLELGTFYRMDSVVAHLAYGEHNPVDLGLAPEEVDVIQGQEPVPPLEELREEAGRSLVESFIRRRLIPLGCVRAAIDAEGEVCVARERRLDAYFGRKVAASELAPAADAESRVVVQPDFSVIVIGPNPTAAAELAPFCDRAPGGLSRGAAILKITRDSVVRAVANGLEPKEIADRLRRHASHEVPANVLHEVRDWSNWVRRVASATIAVLRCPDRDTADRVVGALKRQAERLNDTMVAVEPKLTAAERTKLRAQGIIVEAGGEAPSSKPKARKKRRGW